MKKVLVTGGAGFIGSNLVKRLVEKGYKVTAIDNFERGKLEFVENTKSLKLIVCDLTNYEIMHQFFEGQDIVIHLASKVGGIGVYLDTPYQVMKANMEMDANVLKAVLEYKIDTYFYASSAHIYPKELQMIADSPMIQIIPFKRDSWGHKIKKYDPSLNRIWKKAERYMKNRYKDNFRVLKEWD